MVGRWPTRCLQARRGRTERRNPCSRNPIHAPAPNLTAAQRGWMSEKTPPLRRKGKCFFLTSPFIEPASVEIYTFEFLLFEHGHLALIVGGAAAGAAGGADYGQHR